MTPTVTPTVVAHAEVRFGRGDYVLKEELNTPHMIVEAKDKSTDDFFVQFLEQFANRKHDELRGQYIPHRPLAIARLLEKHIGGKVIGYSKTQGPDPDSPMLIR